MDGLKYDDGKPRLDLIPPDAVMAIGYVMTYGAQKYGANNWQGFERTEIGDVCREEKQDL